MAWWPPLKALKAGIKSTAHSQCANHAVIGQTFVIDVKTQFKPDVMDVFTLAITPPSSSDTCRPFSRGASSGSMELGVGTPSFVSNSVASAKDFSTTTSFFIVSQFPSLMSSFCLSEDFVTLSSNSTGPHLDPASVPGWT